MTTYKRMLKELRSEREELEQRQAQTWYELKRMSMGFRGNRWGLTKLRSVVVACQSINVFSMR